MLLLKLFDKGLVESSEDSPMAVSSSPHALVKLLRIALLGVVGFSELPRWLFLESNYRSFPLPLTISHTIFAVGQDVVIGAKGRREKFQLPFPSLVSHHEVDNLPAPCLKRPSTLHH